MLITLLIIYVIGLVITFLLYARGIRRKRRRSVDDYQWKPGEHVMCSLCWPLTWVAAIYTFHVEELP